MNARQAEAILFDLGGVILNIDYQATTRAFEQLGLEDFSTIYSQAAQSGLFDAFETGQISTQAFINRMLEYLPAGTSPNQVHAAWNAMILNFPPENLELLVKIKAQKPIFLLSNTNEIHISCFNRRLAEVSTENSLHVFFNRVYFSNEIEMRKPNRDSFEFVCSENNLNPKTTLFIDDSLQHIEGAREFGLQTHHLKPGEKLMDLF